MDVSRRVIETETSGEEAPSQYYSAALTSNSVSKSVGIVREIKRAKDRSFVIL